MRLTYSEAIKSALSTVGVKYYHNKAQKEPDSYIVWQETGLDVVAEGHAQYKIEVHHYTKAEYSNTPERITAALNSAGFCKVTTGAVEYSEATGVTHTVIICNWNAIGDNTVIAIIKRVPEGSDEYGAPVWSETSRDVNAVIVEKKLSELYTALSAGLKPDIILRIYAGDYNDEKVLRIGGIDYQITDAHTTDSGTVELVCTDIAKAG